MTLQASVRPVVYSCSGCSSAAQLVTMWPCNWTARPGGNVITIAGSVVMYRT